MKFDRPFKGLFCPVWLAVLLALAPRSGAARETVDLNGDWQYQKVTQLNYPPSNSWQTLTVPGYLSGSRYEHAWYRKMFILPVTMAGNRIKLRFGGVKFDSKVWVNGLRVGGYLNGYEPFELDITAAARIGQLNEIVVGVTDWTATFSQPVDFSTLAPYENPRDHATNALLAPIGGHYSLYGIWQPVEIVAVPTVFIEDVFVMPSVQQKKLTVRVTLRNNGDISQTVTLKNQVLAGGLVAAGLDDASIALAAGASTSVDVSVPWANPRLWSPVDPYLYFLESTLDAGGSTDTVKTRFGFREFWCVGSSCFLNGIKINLLASSTWPPTVPISRTQILKVLSDVKAGNNVAIRLHTQPWDETWYEVADEVGLLVVEEFALWCDSFSYRLSDPVFWSNYGQHLKSAVKRDRNHPSIILWSIENELLHCGGQRAFAGTAQKLAEMGRLVKAVDPTRPITYEADLDPAGEADIIGLHYPHEFPDDPLWPNAAFWMDQSIPKDYAAGGQWKWQRDKPLYIGEFLWIPGSSAEAFTILYGDKAYTDPAFYRNLSKGMTWQMQIEAYRGYGVNGICPWTLFEDPATQGGTFDLNAPNNHLYQSQKAAYHPNAVFVQPRNRRFFTGSSPSRSLSIFNDTLAPGNFALKWRSAESEAWNIRNFSMNPGDKREENIVLNVPSQPGAFRLEIALEKDSAQVFTNRLEYEAHPPTTLVFPPGLRLGVYDPQGNTTNLLRQGNLSWTTVTNLRTAPYGLFNVLLVGRNAFVNETNLEVGPQMLASQWENFAWNGGWILVMEQTTYPRWMPMGLRVEETAATFAFPDAQHAITTNLTTEDLRWWAGDHRLVSRAIRVPAAGNFRVPVRIGSQRGMEYAGMLEWPFGHGGLLCSQLLLNERFPSEPIAGVLWQRMFDYCAQTPAHLRLSPAGLLAETNSSAALKLAQMGLVAQPVSGILPNCDPRLTPVLVIAGGSNTWNEAMSNLPTLVKYVDQGGNLLLHRPDESFLTSARASLFPDLEWSDSVMGAVLLRDPKNAVVTLANHDLYWIETSGSWDRPEVVSTNVARRVYRQRFNLSQATTLEAEAMPIKTAGGAVSGGWCLWSSGQVAQNITIPQQGTYLFNVRAYGSPAGGVWPLMSLRVDGRIQDSVYVNTSQWASFAMSAELNPGTHELAISFDNDLYLPPEDRNLYLDQVQYGFDTQTSPVSILTKPGAIAQVRHGRGWVLLDEIAWDTEARNQVKAGRVASSLLTGLGAAMHLPPGLRLEATEMRNVNVNAYSTNNGLAQLASNGRIETTVTFTSTGTYAFDLTAHGTPAAGGWPVVELRLNGANRKSITVTNTGSGHYASNFPVNAGTYVLALAFVNDVYVSPAEDRNVAIESLVITPEPQPRLLNLQLDNQTLEPVLLWSGVPQKTYQIDICSALGQQPWTPADRVTNRGGVATWTDTTHTDDPQRFYRLSTP